jgi:hypothetical protein
VSLSGFFLVACFRWSAVSGVVVLFVLASSMLSILVSGFCRADIGKGTEKAVCGAWLESAPCDLAVFNRMHWSLCE